MISEKTMFRVMVLCALEQISFFAGTACLIQGYGWSSWWVLLAIANAYGASPSFAYEAMARGKRR